MLYFWDGETAFSVLKTVLWGKLNVFIVAWFVFIGLVSIYEYKAS
jgi:hypothetical protein